MRKRSGVNSKRGMVVSVYGVDGSGKSSVIEGLSRSLGAEFQGVERWHLLQYQRPEVQQVPLPNPHGRPPRPLLQSAAKVGWYLALAWLFRTPAIRRAVGRGRLVLIDRDLADVSLDPVRYRMGGPALFTRMIAVASPRPDVAIVLCADPATIASRSQELDYRELVDLTSVYREFATRHTWTQPVDASEPLNQVIASASRSVAHRYRQLMTRNR